MLKDCRKYPYNFLFVFLFTYFSCFLGLYCLTYCIPFLFFLGECIGRMHPCNNCMYMYCFIETLKMKVCLITMLFLFVFCPPYILTYLFCHFVVAFLISLMYCLQVPLDEDFRKQLVYEFHCANYHGIMEVISGLRTTIGHLIKEVKYDDSRLYNILDEKLLLAVVC